MIMNALIMNMINTLKGGKAMENYIRRTTTNNSITSAENIWYFVCDFAKTYWFFDNGFIYISLHINTEIVEIQITITMICEWLVIWNRCIEPYLNRFGCQKSICISFIGSTNERFIFFFGTCVQHNIALYLNNKAFFKRINLYIS